MQDQQLQDLMQTIIRQWGLLEADQTPCDQPMSPSIAHALQVLARTPCLTQQSLADELRLEKSTTSRMVFELLQRGWVERVENPRDRRERVLSLSGSGRDVAAQLMNAATARYGELWRRLPLEKRSAILDSLAALSNAIMEMP